MADEENEKITEIDPQLKRFQDYFADDIAELDKELAKSTSYSGIIEKEIEKFTKPENGVAPTRGGQHYLIEHIKNAVSLQSQKQSLLKDKVALKKIIMDYSEKFKDEGGNGSIQKELVRFTQDRKRDIVSSQDNAEPLNSQDADDVIDKLLNEKENKDEDNK